METEVQVIVMACNEQEGGKHKCERYWSQLTDEECQFGKYFVRLLKSREICPDFLGKKLYDLNNDTECQGFFRVFIV